MNSQNNGFNGNDFNTFDFENMSKLYEKAEGLMEILSGDTDETRDETEKDRTPQKTENGYDENIGLMRAMLPYMNGDNKKSALMLIKYFEIKKFIEYNGSD